MWNTEIGNVIHLIMPDDPEHPTNQVSEENQDSGFGDNQCPICNGRGFVDGHVCTHPVYINTDKDVQG